MNLREDTTIPTTFDKERVKRLSKTDLLKFYWKVVNRLSQDATPSEFQDHDNNVAYLTGLIGYDPMCE
jgi:hypothetical protein